VCESVGVCAWVGESVGVCAWVCESVCGWVWVCESVCGWVCCGCAWMGAYVYMFVRGCERPPSVGNLLCVLCDCCG
jgi:hypothetical protein